MILRTGSRRLTRGNGGVSLSRSEWLRLSRGGRSCGIFGVSAACSVLVRPFSEAAEPGNSNKTPRFLSIIENQDMLKRIPLEDVRNFCFIAHVDHGKSSLASRVLELAGNQGLEAQKVAIQAAERNAEDTDESSTPAVPVDSKEKIELLDTLAVEQQRGITVKASAATMLYAHPSAKGPDGVLLLNMVDTPGHVDFGREVSRSLNFVQGAVLLLDATQGIQAQTFSVYQKAQSLPEPPHMLVALTKVDLDSARPIHHTLTVAEWLDLDDPEAVLHTSARNRVGIKEVLDTVCAEVPPPPRLSDDDEKDDCETSGQDLKSPMRAQVVDSWFDARGVNCLIQLRAGVMAEGDRIAIAGQEGESYSVQEIGLMLPKAQRTGSLRRGQMGYVRFGLKDPRQAQPGTVVFALKDAKKDLALPTRPDSLMSASNAVLFASVHPMEGDEFDQLAAAVDKLALNDTGLEVTKTSGSSSEIQGGPFLGPGLRIGFQGLLHVEIFRQRLLDEFGLEALVTQPKVPYRISWLPGKGNNLTEPIVKVVEDLAEWPKPAEKVRIEEPVVRVRILAPVEYAGDVMKLITSKRGTGLETKPMDEETWLYSATMPWAEVVTDFHDALKNNTAGYGSLDTSEADPPFQEAPLAKVDLFLNNDIVEPLAFVCHRDQAQAEARIVCQKLQEVLPRRQFVVVIQAKAGNKIIAAERIKAYRKDVLTTGGSKTVGGGDVTRKMKLLAKQKKGKKKLQLTGKVTLSQEAFNSVINRST